MKIRDLTVPLALVCAILVSARPGHAEFLEQGPKLVGTDADFGIGGVVGVYQGWSTAISADGNTAIIGGYADQNGNGAAWIFTRTGGGWTQQGPKLFDRVNDGDFQGFSVGLSGDGNTAIVGADIDHSGVGAAYIWTRSGGVWSQQGGSKLVGSNVLGGQTLQGYSVALSRDGHTAIVGGTFDNNQVGAAWVFTGSGGGWQQQGKLVGSGSAGPSQQGCSVALSGDGNTAAVGGLTDNTTVGAVWIYTRSGGTWHQQQKLVDEQAGVNAAQGSSVALSADGNVALVGGYNDNSGAGAAWVWTRSGTVWTQQGNKLAATDAGGIAQQGYSVSLSADGNTALIGGQGDNGDAGAAWVWKRSGSTWTEQGAKLVGSGAVGAASQGHAVALSGDGKTAIVGGHSDGDNGNAGAAWIFFDSPSIGNPERSIVLPAAPPVPAIVDGRGP
jgi:hypothetical protein